MDLRNEAEVSVAKLISLVVSIFVLFYNLSQVTDFVQIIEFINFLYTYAQ